MHEELRLREARGLLEAACASGGRLSSGPALAPEAGLPLCTWHVIASPLAQGDVGCTGGKRLNDCLFMKFAFSAVFSLGQETRPPLVIGYSFPVAARANYHTVGDLSQVNVSHYTLKVRSLIRVSWG